MSTVRSLYISICILLFAVTIMQAQIPNDSCQYAITLHADYQILEKKCSEITNENAIFKQESIETCNGNKTAYVSKSYYKVKPGTYTLSEPLGENRFIRVFNSCDDNVVKYCGYERTIKVVESFFQELNESIIEITSYSFDMNQPNYFTNCIKRVVPYSQNSVFNSEPDMFFYEVDYRDADPSWVQIGTVKGIPFDGYAIEAINSLGKMVARREITGCGTLAVDDGLCLLDTFHITYDAFGFTHLNAFSSTSGLILRAPDGRIEDFISFEGNVIEYESSSSVPIGPETDSNAGLNISVQRNNLFSQDGWTREDPTDITRVGTSFIRNAGPRLNVYKGLVGCNGILFSPKENGDIILDVGQGDGLGSMISPVNRYHNKGYLSTTIDILANSIFVGDTSNISGSVTCSEYNFNHLSLRNNSIASLTLDGIGSIRGLITFDVHGNDPALHDILQLTGSTAIAGNINIKLDANYDPPIGTSITLITYERLAIDLHQDDAPAGWLLQQDHDAKTINLVKENIVLGSQCESAEAITLSDETCNNIISSSTIDGINSNLNTCSNQNMRTKWYSAIINEEGPYTIDIINQQSIHKIGLYSGTCGSLNQLICSADSLNYFLVEGEYIFSVSASIDEVNGFDLCISPTQLSNSSIENIGINTQNPITSLDVNGSIRLSDDSISLPGVMRFKELKFEGFNGQRWVPLSDENQYSSNTEGDNDSSNEIQQLSLTGNNLTLTLGGTIDLTPLQNSIWNNIQGVPTDLLDGDDVDDADNDPTNEIETWATLAGIPTDIADGDDVDDADASITNEKINSVSLTNTQLTINEGTQDYMVNLADIATPWSKDVTDIYINEKVGISITDPQKELDIDGEVQISTNSSGSVFQLNLIENNSGYARLNFTNTSNKDITLAALPSATTADSKLSFYIEDAGDVMTVTGAYRVGINNNNPQSDLHIIHKNGPANGGLRIQNTSDANDDYWNMYVSSSTDELRLYANATQVGEFNFTSGAYSAISDERMKSGIQPLHFEWSKFMLLNAANYSFLHDANKRQYLGLLAQEVQEIYPELVQYDEEEDTYRLDYSGTGVIAIKAVQELKNENEVLKDDVNSLSKKNNEFKNLYIGLKNENEKMALMILELQRQINEINNKFE